jgi:hypothetical protein
VEAVPTPEENIPLLTYFLEMGILNGFGPCCLAARQIAQKKGLSADFPVNLCLSEGSYGRKIHGVPGLGKMRSF